MDVLGNVRDLNNSDISDSGSVRDHMRRSPNLRGRFQPKPNMPSLALNSSLPRTVRLILENFGPMERSEHISSNLGP